MNKQKSKILLLPLKYYKIQISIALFLVISIYIFNIILSTYLIVDYQKYSSVDNNELFIISASSELDVKDFQQIISIDADESKLEHYEVDPNIDLYSLDVSKYKTSQSLNEEIAEYENNLENLKFYIYPNYTSNEVMNDNISNLTYNIDCVLEGEYPKEKDEVLIGEYLAIGYLNEFGYDSYDDLIGQEISLNIEGNIYEFKISGVAAGTKDILANSENDIFVQNYTPEMDSYYKEFESEKAKLEYIHKTGLDEYKDLGKYIDSNNTSNNWIFIICMITLAISALTYFSMILISFKNDMYVLSYYKSNKKISYLILVIPIILFLLITFMWIMNIY